VRIFPVVLRTIDAITKVRVGPDPGKRPAAPPLSGAASPLERLIYQDPLPLNFARRDGVDKGFD